MSSSDESDEYPELESLNISNDQYYQPLPGFKPRLPSIDEGLDIPKYGSDTIQHSLPAYDLWRAFFPTYMSEVKYRNFHRPKLRHYNSGPQARRIHNPRSKRTFPIKSLSRTIYRYQKRLRNNVISAINIGMSREEITNKYLLINKAKDLTAKRGELFLFEYSEEFPPILSQVGMASNVKTYINPQNSSNHLRIIHKNQQQPQDKNTPSNMTTTIPNNIDNNLNSSVYGTSILNASSAIESSQLGNKTNENTCVSRIGVDVILNEKSKPIYFSQLKPGQKQQVIENNMFRAPIFQHQMPGTDFLVVRTRNSFYIRTIGTIFTVGQTMPLTLIPQPTDAAILKFRVELSNLFIHKLFMESDAEPPSINLDLLAKLFPDYDKQVLLRRLTSNGVVRVNKGPQSSLYERGSSKYGQLPLKELRNSFPPEKYCANMSMLAARQRLRELNYTESMINPPADVVTETEVLAAPWNTSKAVVNTLTNRCYLDLKKHLIDPTGPQREGFSCVAWTKSPTEDQQNKDRQNGSRSVTPIEKLSSIPTKNPLALKITREKLERLEIYKREAMLLAGVQSNVLNSKEVLSSDEGEDDEADEDDQLNESFDEQLRDLDRLIVDGQTEQELNFEKEEDERLKMLEELKQNGSNVTPDATKTSSIETTGTPAINLAAFKGKILKIVRTYQSDEGLIERTEIVRDPKVIALYVKQKGGSANQSQISMTQKGDHLYDGDNASRISDVSSIFSNRRKSITLGPSELCRADGIVLTISKKVLNQRAMRKKRRESLRSE